MPARTAYRCRPKLAGDLGLLEELALVEWVPLIPGTGFRSIDALRAAWSRHGGRILANYVDRRPGTRPFAMYALGELPLPRLKHEPGEGSMHTVIGDRTIWSPWYYFGTRTGQDGHYCAGSAWGEFEHLRRLKVIDAAEARAAAEWIDDRYYDPDRPGRPYVALAR